jgi:hypothetical protein
MIRWALTARVHVRTREVDSRWVSGAHPADYNGSSLSPRPRGVRLFELPANRLLLTMDEFAYPMPDDFEIVGRY